MEWVRDCDYGPVRVALTVKDGRPTRLRGYVGGKWRAAGGEVVDLGTVSVKDVTDYLLVLAEKDEGRVGKQAAVFGLSQRRQSEGVPALIKIARTNKDPEVRKKALFWLGQSGDPRAVALFEEILSK